MTDAPRRSRRAAVAAQEQRVAALLDDMLGPALPGRPACVGLAPLHDGPLWGEPLDHREARHHRAMAVCRRCPVLAACTALLAQLPDGTTGVWAGRVLGVPSYPRPDVEPMDPEMGPSRPVDPAPLSRPIAASSTGTA